MDALALPSPPTPRAAGLSKSPPRSPKVLSSLNLLHIAKMQEKFEPLKNDLLLRAARGM